MKYEDILKCHREIEDCLDGVAASFASQGLRGNVSVVPGHEIQISLVPEDDDENIICCCTTVLHKGQQPKFDEAVYEELGIAVCDRVERSVKSILRRHGFDVSGMAFIVDMASAFKQ